MADPGGPFTEQSRGTALPPDLLMPDPADQPAVEDAITKAANAGLGVAEGGRQREAARRQLQIGAPDYGEYRLTKEDFFPGEGVQESRSTSVGNYPGSPIFAASAPRATMTLFAARGQALHEKQRKLDEATQKLMTGDGLDKAPAPYQRGWDQEYDQSWNQNLAEETAYYGNERDAIREMSKPGTRANQRLMRMNRNYNTLVGENKYTFDRSVALNAGLRDGSSIADPETAAISAEYEAGMRNVTHQSVEQMAELNEKLTARISVLDYMKDRGIYTAMKDAYAELDTLPELYRAPGGGLFAVQEKIKTAETAKVQFKKEMKAFYPDDVVGDKTIDEIVDGLFPDDKLVEWRQYSVNAPKESNAPGAEGADVQFAATVVSPTDQSGDGMAGPTSVEVSIAEKGLPTKPRDFRDENGAEVHLAGVKYRTIGGQWYFSGKGYRRSGQRLIDGKGKELSSSTAAMIAALEQNGGDVEKLTEDQFAKFQQLPEIDVPLDANQDKNKLYFGGYDPQGAVGGGAAPAQTASEQPPMDGAKKAPDGKWYVQKEGKWFRVE